MNHKDALAQAIARIEDLLQGDDGQAYKEAQKALPHLKKTLAAPVKLVLMEYNHNVYESSFECVGLYYSEDTAKAELPAFKAKQFRNIPQQSWQQVRFRLMEPK